MIPQIQSLQDIPEDDKVKLVEDGLAVVAPSGELFISLELVNRVGLKLMEQDPSMLVACEQFNCDMSALAVASPSDSINAITGNLVKDLYNTLRQAVVQGIPLYPAFRYFMAQERKDRCKPLDYTPVLLSASNALAEVKKRQHSPDKQ